jgi:hypothetical protein
MKMKFMKFLLIGLSLVSLQAFSYGNFNVAQDAKRLQFAAHSLANTLSNRYGYRNYYLARKARLLAFKAGKVKLAARRGASRYVVRMQFRQTLRAFLQLRRSLRHSYAMRRPLIRYKARRVGRNMRSLRNSVRYYSGYGRYYRRYSSVNDSWIGIDLGGNRLYFKF